jgi:hypothetical protein
MNKFLLFVLVSCLFLTPISCSDGSSKTTPGYSGSSESSSTPKYTQEELQRLNYYGSVKRALDEGTQEEKQKIIMDMMGKMQSGQLPQDPASDAHELLNR